MGENEEIESNSEINSDEQKIFPDPDEQDLKLDVSNIKVGSVKLEVDKLNANIYVKAQLADFINIEVGTKIELENVKLEVSELEAKVDLEIRLKRIENVLLNALQTLQNNPDFILANKGDKTDEQLKESIDKLSKNQPIIKSTVTSTEKDKDAEQK